MTTHLLRPNGSPCRPSFVVALAMLLVATVLSSCAKQGYPSGGPKDTAPPTVLATKPLNETRHFDQQAFYLGFDEYAVVRDADNNVIISPPLKQKPEYVVKGKGLWVRFSDTLLPDATYLFQFKGALADFNEGNVLPSFEYVFSTGAELDTMMICGHIVNARNDKPSKEVVTVMAYRDSTHLPDTIGASAQPDYITRCNPDGSFAFHYIRQGSYRLVAVEDKNRNLRIGHDETSAWTPTAVAALDSLDSNQLVLMRLSAPDLRQQRLLKSEFTARGRATIVSYLPMHHPSLTGDSLVWRLNSQRDTMRVWFLNDQCDSAKLVLTDSAFSDTLRLRYSPPRRRGRRAAATTAPESLIRPLCEGKNAFYDDLRLAFSMPILTPADTLTVEVLHPRDSASSRCTLTFDSLRLEATLDTTLRSGEDYRINLRHGLFTDLFGHPSDSLSFSLTPRDYGTLHLHVANRAHLPLVVELLDEKDSVRASQPLPASGLVTFSHLNAEEYRLRAVLDADSNGRWTTGDYFLQRPPEAYVYYPKTLQVREKWELEERWTLYPPRPNALTNTLPDTP